MAYDRETLEPIRRILLERRHALVQSARGSQRELEALQAADRPPEYEESAQTAAASYVLSTLGAGQRREVAEIDDALARIDAGTFGVCVDCGANISLQRLAAVPTARRDAGCESLVEVDELGGRNLPSL